MVDTVDSKSNNDTIYLLMNSDFGTSVTTQQWAQPVTVGVIRRKSKTILLDANWQTTKLSLK